MTKPIGLVLAGGSGRRMGRSKGDLRVEGQRLARRAARVLEPLCRGVLISVRPGGDNPAPGYAVVEDAPPPGRGPLAGIHAGFVASADADLLVLACDYVRVGTELMRGLLENARGPHDLVLVAGVEGRVHPLVGLWRRSIASDVARALDSDRLRVLALVDRCRTRRLGPEELPGHDLERVLVNLNSPADLDALE